MGATKACENMICLYSTQTMQGSNFGFKNCGSFSEEFIYQSLQDLKQNLLKKNIWLYVIENISFILEKLNERFDLRIFYDKEVGTYEKKFEEELDKYTTKSFFNQTMIDEFEFDYTKSFSHFRKKAEALEIIKPLDEISAKKQLFMCVDIKEIK